MIAVSTDYTGRTVDLEALQTGSTLVSGDFSLSTTMTKANTARRITGMQKLAQRYAILFLTVLGSVRFNAGQGTGFVRAVMGGSVQNRNGLLGQFMAADGAVRNQLALETQAGDPADEQLASSTLLDFDLTPGSASLRLRVSLVSRAGEAYTFIIPTA